MDNRLINRIQIKQVQRVGTSLISGHCQFIIRSNLAAAWSQLRNTKEEL